MLTAREDSDIAAAGLQTVSLPLFTVAAPYNWKTKAGCKESIQSAIKEAPSVQRRYVQKEWWDTMADWANYARCHSALLLQVDSTNPVKSWHSSPKYRVKKEMTHAAAAEPAAGPAAVNPTAPSTGTAKNDTAERVSPTIWILVRSGWNLT